MIDHYINSKHMSIIPQIPSCVIMRVLCASMQWRNFHTALISSGLIIGVWKYSFWYSRKVLSINWILSVVIEVLSIFWFLSIMFYGLWRNRLAKVVRDYDMAGRGCIRISIAAFRWRNRHPHQPVFPAAILRIGWIALLPTSIRTSRELTTLYHMFFWFQHYVPA